MTAPAVRSIYVDMGAVVGLFFSPLSSNSTSLRSSKPSCNAGTMDAACSFFTAPHYCCSSPEKRLPGHDKLCAGSVICVSSNFPLIHLYILDGKHSLGAAINYAAVATKGRPASWGIAGACRAPGPEEGVKSSLCTCQRSRGVGADPAPTARPRPLASSHPGCRGDVMVGSRARANAASWPPRRRRASVGCLKPATVLGRSLTKTSRLARLRSPAAPIHPSALFGAAVLFCSFNFLYNPPIDNLRAFSFKNGKSATLADSPNDYLSCYR